MIITIFVSAHWLVSLGDFDGDILKLGVKEVDIILPVVKVCSSSFLKSHSFSEFAFSFFQGCLLRLKTHLSIFFSSPS